MRSKIRYQLLDPSNSAPRNCRIFWFALLFTASVCIYLAMFLLKNRDSVYDPSLVPDKRHPTTYETVMDDLRNEIEERNRIINELQRDFKNLEIKSELKPSYRRRPETAHVDCGRIMEGDKAYLETVSGKTNRVKIVENANLNMSCPAIMDRILPSDVTLKPLKRGVAFARIVYADYEMIEKQVQMSYHPQNAFCFAIDRKAPPKFHEQLKAMAECLPNVLLLRDEQSVDSSGHNINLAHYNCLRVLNNKPGWSYAILLQNHDVIVKSVYEMEQIYEWLGGANDIEITPEAGRLDQKRFKWDPRSLKLFRNETGMDEKLLTTPMKFAKGAAQGSLSRAAVDWMVRTADLSTYISQWNKGSFGVDEQFIQSFQFPNFSLTRNRNQHHFCPVVVPPQYFQGLPPPAPGATPRHVHVARSQFNRAHQLEEPEHLSINLAGSRCFDVHRKLSRLVLSRDTLKSTGFVVFNESGRASVHSLIPREWVHFDDDLRVCVRCGEQFIMKSLPANEVLCRFHIDQKGACCGREEPCRSALRHVHNTTSSSELLKFMPTFDPVSATDWRSVQVYGLDTEMVYTESGMEVGRVTLVDHQLRVVLDTFVKPEGQLIDLNTEFSGIRAENLTNAVCFEQVRAQLLVVMNSETILVGHHLSNDLKVLKLVHPKIVDTAVMFRTSEGRFRSLKALAQFHLGKRIHEGLDGHDSAEDATICLELVAKRYPELVQNWST